MKIAPVSGDLLVKLALAGALAGAAWYAWQRAKGAAAGLVPDISALANQFGQAVNPLSPNNLAYRTTTAATTAAVGYSDTIGGAAYSLSHLDPANPNAAVDLWNSISAGDTAY